MDILHAIGNTSMVRLRKVPPNCSDVPMHAVRSMLAVALLCCWIDRSGATELSRIGIAPDEAVAVFVEHNRDHWYYVFRRGSRGLGRVESAFEYPSFEKLDSRNAELIWRPDGRYLVIKDGRGMDSAPPDIVVEIRNTSIRRIDIPMPDIGSYVRSTYPSFRSYGQPDTAVFTVPTHRDWRWWERTAREKIFTYTVDLRSGKVVSVSSAP